MLGNKLEKEGDVIMGIYLLIGLLLMILIEAHIKKKADNGELFKNVGKFKTEDGSYHDFDYYYDKESKEYKRIGE